jgi:2,4-didehydro-3-deoxy-L-rhamnonate hydrolase
VRLINHNNYAAVAISDTRAVDLVSINNIPFAQNDLPTSPGEIAENTDRIRTALSAILPAHILTLSAPIRSPLGSPIGTPRQVFGIGLNYRSHAAETNAEIPTQPMVFTKFPSCISGPNTTVKLNSKAVDWEAELVVIIGRECRNVTNAEAWDCVAGLCVGQDLSDRQQQIGNAKHPQYNIGKSLDGFGPIGPALVTVDELASPDDLEIICTLNDEIVQHARTSDMIFNVPGLVAWLSSKVTLWPGDAIFTGTPSGVGAGRTPMRFLQPGDVLTTTITGVGTITTRFEAP